MLLDPELNQQFGEVEAEGGQAVEAGVTAGADGDQPIEVVDAGLAVMHMQPVGRAAGPAQTAVPVEDFIPEPGEAVAGAGKSLVAAAAEAGSPGEVAAARAEEGALGGRSQESMVRQNSRR